MSKRRVTPRVLAVMVLALLLIGTIVLGVSQYVISRPAADVVSAGEYSPTAAPPVNFETGPTGWLIASGSEWDAAWEDLTAEAPKIDADYDESKVVLVSLPSGISGGREVDVEKVNFTGTEADVTVRTLGACGGMWDDRFHYIAINVPTSVEKLNLTHGADRCTSPRSLMWQINTHVFGEERS